jgi:hypothetical protein
MNNKQLKLIWGLAKKIKFDSDVLHGLIWDLFVKRSLKELTLPETQKLIEKLNQLAGNVTDSGYHSHLIKVNDDGNLIKYASPAEIYYIRFLARKLNFNTDKSLFDFIKNRFDVKIGKLEDLTAFQSRSVVLSLKTKYQNKCEKVLSADSQKSLL